MDEFGYNANLDMNALRCLVMEIATMPKLKNCKTKMTAAGPPLLLRVCAKNFYNLD